MDSILTKYILFGVGIIITIIIITVLIMSVSGVAEIYGQVTKTDISIRNKVDNLIHKYDDNVFNGVDVVNTLKMYENEENVEIKFEGVSNDINFAFSDSTVQAQYTRLSEYINDVMNEKWSGVKPALNQCTYYQLFYCDVIQEGSKYKVIFDYHT